MNVRNTQLSTYLSIKHTLWLTSELKQLLLPKHKQTPAQKQMPVQKHASVQKQKPTQKNTAELQEQDSAESPPLMQKRAWKLSPRLDSYTGRNGASGSTLIELSMLSVLFVVMAVLSLDVGYVLMGSEMNDRACRDAARAAAQGDSYATALQLAQVAVVAHAGDGVFVSNPTVDSGAFSYQDFGGNPPPNTSPFVSVTTNTNIKIPAPIFFLGSAFGENGTMRFTKTYVFPIVKTQLYL